MNRYVYCFFILLTLMIGSQPCQAARVKAYVNRFTVSTAANRDEMKSSLQILLMSRINSDEIQAVDNQADAEIQIEGSYITFGPVFSIDALLKTSSGAFIDRVFVQGDTQNDLLPTVSLMAKHLRRAIMKWNPALTDKPVDGSLPVSVEKTPLPPEKKETTRKTKTAPIAKTAAKQVPAPVTLPVNAPEVQKPSEPSWSSHRLPETLNGIAVGRTIDKKGVELFITGERYLRYYHKARNMQFLTAVAFPADEKIIGVDVADLDRNEVPEVYVTVLKNGQPTSKVYIPEDRELKKIADNIPYMLRSVTIDGTEKKVFAQKLAADGKFTGDVFELIKSGDNFTAENPMKLPAFGNLYNFNRFANAKGERFFIVGHPDGYLLVYTKDRKQLWKSRDKFGGSEALVCQSAGSDPSSQLNTACSAYLPQRLLVTKAGNIFVPRNTGMSTSAAARTYAKSNVVRFIWNGSALKEISRTEQSQNYLADFSYDDQAGELLLLEVEQQTDKQEERGSRVVAKRM
jgi:hypothetical protein